MILKWQHEKEFLYLCLDCGGAYMQKNVYRTTHARVYAKTGEGGRCLVDCTDWTSIGVLALVSSYIRCHHEGKCVKDTHGFSGLFATTYKSIIISK